jgi:5-methylcytosine-specific restriction endonuclease McrA
MTSHIPAALRQRVAEAAQYRCGYCLTAERIVGPLLEIDHIIPEARGGANDESNLWLACPMCNSRKADRMSAQDPESNATVPLFNPRAESWDEHFAWGENGSVIRGKTPTGRATVAALSMNHADIVSARRLWVAVGWHPPIDC